MVVALGHGTCVVRAFGTTLALLFEFCFPAGPFRGQEFGLLDRRGTQNKGKCG
jgi:hypothetical protein